MLPADYTAPIAANRTIDLDPLRSAQTGLPAGAWTLSRVVAHSATHVHLRHTHPSGREVVGQWFADETAFAGAARATRQAALTPAHVVTHPQHRLFWQLGGADRKLPQLALLCQAGARLIAHHPERRAVVRLANASHYVKVVRPERAAALADGLQWVANALAATGPLTPKVVSVNPSAGLVVMTALPGRSLLTWLADDACTPDQVAALGCQAGQAIAALHQSQAPRLAVHDAAAEAATLDRKLRRLGWVAPALQNYLDQWRPTVQTALLANSSPRHVPLHRDCYDKQFIGGDMGMGLLDFDTLAWGEAALDVANFLIHCDVRAWQGCCSYDRAAALAAAFLQGYGVQTLPRDRLQAYADVARLRLACVYGCRPPQIAIVTRLIESIGAPLIGLE